jgi:hypothetical protein
VLIALRILPMLRVAASAVRASAHAEMAHTSSRFAGSLVI